MSGPVEDRGTKPGPLGEALAIVACFLVCLLFPVVVLVLGETYRWDNLRSAGDFSYGPVHAICLCFWADFFSTVALIWVMRGYRWLVALVAVPLLLLTAVAAFFALLAVEGPPF